MIREETEQDHLLNPVFRDYDGKVNEQEVIVYRKDLNQRVSNYTKNISQSIFSPGDLPNQSFIRKQRIAEAEKNRKTGRATELKHHKLRKAPIGTVTGHKKPVRLNSANPTASKNTQKLDKVARSLNEEARKKQKLRAQIDEMKSNMSTYQASIAAGKY